MKILRTFLMCMLGLTLIEANPETTKLKAQKWSFSGLFGTFDRHELQRGFQVYKTVCASCHGLKLVYYRNLENLGYNEAEIKAIAGEATVHDGPNDEGEMFDRPGRPSDRFVSPFRNAKAARAANNGALPPDLSLVVKARSGGADYIYSILTGYADPPKDFHLMDGLHYNTYFPGHQIAMLAPLTKDAVTYADGTPATVHRMAKDVTTFLVWASDPHQEARRKMGFAVLVYLIFLSALLYLSMRRIWGNAPK